MIHHTIEKLRHLRLTGMAKALEGQLSQPDIDTLSFDERLALLIDHEDIERQNAALARRLPAMAASQPALCPSPSASELPSRARLATLMVRTDNHLGNAG